MSDIYTNIDEMIVLLHHKIELVTKLKRALRLADLLGIPPKSLKEPVSMRVRDSDAVHQSHPKPWLFKVLSVRVGDAPWEDFALKDVHHDLWPDDMLKAYGLWQKRNNTTKE